MPALECPWCASSDVRWQGSDGVGLHLLWRQGKRNPVDHLVEPHRRIGREGFRVFSLPASFAIVGSCPQRHSIRAVCKCVDGVWAETDISGARREAAGFDVHAMMEQFLETRGRGRA